MYCINTYLTYYTTLKCYPSFTLVYTDMLSVCLARGTVPLTHFSLFIHLPVPFVSHWNCSKSTFYSPTLHCLSYLAKKRKTPQKNNSICRFSVDCIVHFSKEIPKQEVVWCLYSAAKKFGREGLDGCTKVQSLLVFFNNEKDYFHMLTK